MALGRDEAVKTEFPDDIAGAIEFIGVMIEEYPDLQPPTCMMIRMGMVCENDAQRGMLYSLGNGRHGLLAMCEMCWNEITRTPGQQRTYWRAFQKLIRTS